MVVDFQKSRFLVGIGIKRTHAINDNRIPAPKVETYPPARGLADTVHELEIFKHAVPDIVVNLGTNDFSAGLDAEAFGSIHIRFRDAYRAFLTRLRGHYPTAALIVSVGPVLTDDWPPGFRARRSLKDDVDRVVKERRAEGDANIHFLIHAQQEPPYGEDWHLEPPPPGTLSYEIVDGEGASIPARMIIRGTEGTKDPMLGPRHSADGAGNVRYTATGVGELPLPAGQYRVTATHGPEFTVYHQDIVD